jgi:hypothetical protein
MKRTIFFFYSSFRSLFILKEQLKAMMELFALAGFGTEAASASSNLMSTTSAMNSQDCGPFGQSCGKHSALQVMPSAI